MKRILSLFLLVMVLAVVAGCSSLEYKSGGDPQMHPGHPGHEVH